MEIIIGILSSFIASIVFLQFLIRLRPNIEISPYISYGDNNGNFRIKIINRSKRDAINLKYELSIVTPVNVPNGTVSNYKTLKLKKDNAFEIKGFDKSDTSAGYAKRIVTSENLYNMWNDEKGNYLVFRMIVTDSLSGFHKVFRREFHTKRNVIVKGSHVFGNSLEVK